MDLDIAGRTTLVLGAGGGLGRAIALALAREGVKTALADINAAALGATAEAVAAAGWEAFARLWDLTDLDSIVGNMAAVAAALGPVDILINNTGGPPQSRPPVRIPRSGAGASRR
jgi:3-oxoacyl-[acyl-carrier protein] reductase